MSEDKEVQLDVEDKPLTWGQTVTGQIIEGDQAHLPEPMLRTVGDAYYRDGYAIDATAGDRVLVDFTSDFDAVLILFGPAEEVIGEVPVSADERGKRIPATFGNSGQHRLVVMTSQPSATGRYLVALNDAEAAPPPLAQPVPVMERPISQDRPLVYGQTYRDELEPSDKAYLPDFMPRGGDDFYHDGYTFEGEEGDAVTVSIEADFSAYLYLWSPEGVIVSQSMNFAGADLTHTLEHDGVYRITVTSDWPTASLGDPPHPYALTLEKAE
jgi:hypothetical protein